jgi:hypothetical protein
MNYFRKKKETDMVIVPVSTQIEPYSYEEFVDEFKYWSDSWYHNIQLSLGRNLSLFPGNTGDYGELFGSFITGKLGTASGGSGFDLSNGVTADESKLCVWVQPKVCNCGTKTVQNKSIFFKNEKCECGREFKYVKDSRWGIDSKAGVIYNEQLDNYILQLIEPVEYKYDNFEFVYSCWFINGKDSNFHEYLVNQNENSKSNNCNLVPYSFDFYRGHPKLKVKLKIILTKNGSNINKLFWNLDNDKNEKMPFDIVKKEEILFLDDSIKNAPLKKMQEEMKSKFVENLADFLPLRSKSLNKERGITSRKI